MVRDITATLTASTAAIVLAYSIDAIEERRRDDIVGIIEQLIENVVNGRFEAWFTSSTTAATSTTTSTSTGTSTTTTLGEFPFRRLLSFYVLVFFSVARTIQWFKCFLFISITNFINIKTRIFYLFFASNHESNPIYR